MPEKSLKRNAFLNVLRTIMSLFFPLITFPYASRILLPEGIGKVNFSNSIVSYFGVIASLGIGTYGIREAAKLRHDKILLSQFTIELFTLNIISTIIAYVLLFCTIFFVPKFSDYKSLLYICSTTILFTTMGIDWLYGALEEYGYIAFRSVLFQIISIILLFLLVKTKDDYIQYASIGVISSVGANICNIIHARKYLTFNSLRRLNIQQHVKPVLVFFGSTLAISVFTILDTSMLGFLSTNTEVGYYTAATKLIRMVRDMFPAIFTVLSARLSIYAETKEQTNKFNTLIEKMLNFIMLLGFPIIAGLYLLAKPIISILSGTAFLPAVPTMYVMVPVILFSSIAGFLGGSVLNSLNKERLYLQCVITGAIINFSLNFILIKPLGAFGAGTATIITEFLLMSLYIIITRKEINFKILYKPFCQYLLSIICMTVCLIPLKLLLHSNIFQIIFIPITGCCIYGVCLLLLKNEFIITLINSFKIKLNRK